MLNGDTCMYLSLDDLTVGVPSGFANVEGGAVILSVKTSVISIVNCEMPGRQLRFGDINKIMVNTSFD